MNLKIIFTSLLFLSWLIILGCQSDDDVVCTTEFKIITVSILDQDSNRVVFDDFVVLDKDSGIDVTPLESNYPLELAQNNGQYPIVNDGSIELNTIRVMTFIGYIDSQEVVRSDYKATEEQCGVRLISGKRVLVIG